MYTISQIAQRLGVTPGRVAREAACLRIVVIGAESRALYSEMHVGAIAARLGRLPSATAATGDEVLAHERRAAQFDASIRLLNEEKAHGGDFIERAMARAQAEVGS